MTKQIKNVLIRDLTAEDNQTIQAVMRETGCYQASKALLRTAYAYLRLVAMSHRQTVRIKQLEAENRVLRQSTAAIVEAVRKIEKVLSEKNT
ncbi:hypothetical protein DW986_03235 [Parabacteroides merdae]|jgi:hypothetical protein|uniref:Uncharacterized protein n=1 Tax=Parabacteroides merdae TaxID=46503 RepID=A0A414XL94_9BACT|nr:hypothetical protein [Parabacteroides merdae]ECO5453941.1 hypothetical protein [Campylobacter coli]RGZ50293.1 hypothetical protein DW986_03235 [Parabacteroides merdae]RHH74682.1 hypothetical protein DW191_17355 [Parabacteroides merdae]DAY51108.1 MAG TPA: hypothetical protein [Caudoviricetes sp.]